MKRMGRWLSVLLCCAIAGAPHAQLGQATHVDARDPAGTADAKSLTRLRPQAGVPTLSIDDVSLAEGNAGTTTYTFTVSLSAAAGPGGVTFDIATADGTATAADSDYAAKSLTGQTIPDGSSTYTFTVLVNGDTTPEPNEAFFVNVTNIVGATVADGQGQGTINDDDVVLTPIHDIQGPGASSPIVGASVTTRGIVTGLKSNGFFLQEPDASVDADPATSEGIFVFTSSAPPAAAVIGALVQVTGTVAEFVPAQDPLQPPLTELTSPTVVQLSTGNPLPASIPLTASFPDPAGPFDQLERIEGMRVSVSSLTAVAPTLGNVNEANATATSTGVFFGVVSGVARPFREAGIRPPDTAPSGTIPPIPRFDGNPELIRVDSDGQTGGPAVDVGTGAIVTGIVGPLDYSSRYYTILPDPSSSPSVSGGPTATAVTPPLASEFTIASYSLQRFFDDVNDPAISDAVLTSVALGTRLTKASLGIRDFMRAPDIIGVVEVENLSTLQMLATRISNDAVAASQPDPLYAAYLVEGNDIGGMDVGFLVKTATVFGSTPRVTVNAVVQELAGTLFVNPDSSTAMLNDRPPLRLDAVVNHSSGASFPVTVIVNHLRSLSGVDSTLAGPNGWPTEGERVRAKRLAQANDLSGLIQTRQTDNPSERIIVIGDLNAFDVNDGFVHSIATIAGAPVPDDQTVVPGDGVDLVNPDLTNLVGLVTAAQRYGVVLDGSASNLDHVLVNASAVSATVARRLEHARINADFPETARNLATVERLSDHDPLVSYFQVAAFQSADLSVAKTDSPDPVVVGTNLTYTITVTNSGPDAAPNASMSDTLPAGTTFVSLASPAGWSCTTPAVGATGTVSCSNASFAVGSAVFTLTVSVAPGVASGTVLSNTASVSSATGDPVTDNNSATTTTTVTTVALLSATKTVAGTGIPGTALVYTITVMNNGTGTQADNPGHELVDVLPSSLTLVSAGATSGTAVATVATNTVTWDGSIPAGGSVTITINATISPSATPGLVITNQATLAYDADGNGTNEAGAATDDPATGAGGDGTNVTIAANARGPTAVPALGGIGLAVLALLLAFGGALVRGRRRG